MNQRSFFLRFDFILAAVTVSIALIGAVLISSATHNTPLERLWVKQLIFVCFGTVAMLIAGLVNYRLVIRFSTPIYVVVIAALLFLLLLLPVKV